MNGQNLNKKIGFIGQGWIGKSYADDFERRGFDIVRYALEEPYVRNGHGISECDIVFIAVPTPTTPRGFDDAILRQVIKKIGRGKIAVIKSTVLPGATEKIQEENPGIFVLHSPEFLTEATAAHDSANPQRNIIGLPIDNSDFRRAAQEAMKVLPYAPYSLVCSSREAELIKYGGNNWFYFKVVFINMFFDLVAKSGARWEVVRDAMAADWRIGRTHLDPIHKSGRGAGGHCFIKDFAAFHKFYEEMVGDSLGKDVLESVKNKNIDLLISSKKDLDLLSGVYGEEVFNDALNRSLFPVPSQKKRSAKCLVTGGAGFIGSHLVDELVSRGNEVIVIDDLSAGKREYLNPGAKLYQEDIRNLNAIKPLFEGVDYVFHLAARPRVQPSIQDPVGSNDVNLNGTLNVLVASRDAKVKKVIYSASSSAYGDQEKMPLREDMPTNPMSPYAMQKHMGEQYCRLFSELYGLPTVALRYFNVYGRRQPLEGAYTLVLGIFVRQRLAGKPMTIVGDGEQKRDFTGVADVVRANILAANSSNVGKGEVINIGRGSNHSVNQIAGIIGGPRINISPRIEPKETLADNSLAKELLGWEPTINLLEWLAEYKKEIGLE
ncbi:MAG: NAD-dependent epimerase/dehydratase family protein [Candidatus Portnoybacteria bacterium]|nr:NAD-dependent epimerase/dehydratase family protein [Candidatus Portnoybacteria bacterium]